MTPLLPHHDPDRPSTGEVVGAFALAVAAAILWWVASVMFTPIP